MRSLFLCFVLFSTTLFSQEKLVLNTAWYPPEQKLIETILDELFSATELEYTLQPLPPERAVKNANLGLDDGDALRIYEIIELYPNLRRVNEHFFTANFSAFYIKDHIFIKNVEHMKGKRVAIVNGIKIVQKFVKDNQFSNITTTLDKDRALVKLLNEEVDLIIINRRAALSRIKKMHLEKVILEHKPSLIQKKMYLYLHKKHEALIPALEKELKQMKKDGRFQKIIEAYIAAFPSEKGIIDAR